MSLSAALAANIILDLAVIAGVALAMARATRLKPHAQPS